MLIAFPVAPSGKADIRPGHPGELTGRVGCVGRQLDDLPSEASGG